jgi:hypothetical protein
MQDVGQQRFGDLGVTAVTWCHRRGGDDLGIGIGGQMPW